MPKVITKNKEVSQPDNLLAQHSATFDSGIDISSADADYDWVNIPDLTLDINVNNLATIFYQFSGVFRAKVRDTGFDDYYYEHCMMRLRLLHNNSEVAKINEDIKIRNEYEEDDWGDPVPVMTYRQFKNITISKTFNLNENSDNEFKLQFGFADFGQCLTNTAKEINFVKGKVNAVRFMVGDN